MATTFHLPCLTAPYPFQNVGLIQSWLGPPSVPPSRRVLRARSVAELTALGVGLALRLQAVLAEALLLLASLAAARRLLAALAAALPLQVAPAQAPALLPQKLCRPHELGQAPRALALLLPLALYPL